MWEISNQSQITNFIFAIVLGVFFAVFYDLFRAIRIIKFHSSIAVFFEDIAYFSIISLFTFIFFLSATAGEIRGYILIGIFLGFILFYLTISKYYLKALCIIFRLLFRVNSAILKYFYLIFEKIDNLITGFFINALNCFKKLLKK